MQLHKRNIDQCLIFIFTAFAYASLHASRKVFSNVKPAMLQQLTATEPYLNITVYPLTIWARPSLFTSMKDGTMFFGTLDFLFMSAYAVGLYLNGWLGDHVDPLNLLCGGTLGSAIVVFLFGTLTEWMSFYNRSFYAILWVINGFFQSAIWPCAVTIISNWFDRAHGLIFGLWSTCASVGNIFGDLLVANVVDYGYEYPFLIVSVVLACTAVVLFFGIKPAPIEVDAVSSDNTSLLNDPVDIATVPSPNHLTCCQIILLPGVIIYAFVYGSIKLVNYSFFFWLPYYLSNNFGWTNAMASAISVWFDVGGFVGSVLAGGLSDLPFDCFSRHFVIVSFLFLCVPCLFLYRITPDKPLSLNGFVMGLIGFAIGGPSSLVSTVIGADLANVPELRGMRILSTVTGFIDGTGSVGAALGQLMIPALHHRFGWSAVFDLFIVATCLAVLGVLPFWLKDCINLRRASRAARIITTDTN